MVATYEMRRYVVPRSVGAREAVRRCSVDFRHFC